MQENGNNLTSMKADLVSAKESHKTFADLLAQKNNELEQDIALLREKFKRSNAELILNEQLASQNAAELEKRLRDLIAAIYAGKVEAAKILGQDHKAVEKSFGDGLSVRVTPKFQYSQDDAVGWAAQNAPFMILRTVDAKQFEAAMKGLKELPEFVAEKESVTAVICLK